MHNLFTIACLGFAVIMLLFKNIDLNEKIEEYKAQLAKCEGKVDAKEERHDVHAVHRD